MQDEALRTTFGALNVGMKFLN